MKTGLIFVVLGIFIAGAWVVGMQERGEAAPDAVAGTTWEAAPIEVVAATPPEEPIILTAATEKLDTDAGDRPIPDVQEIIAAFQATLAKQIPFVFNFTDTGHVSHRASSPQTMDLRFEGDRTYHMAGELGSDGHRVAYRNRTWGQYNGVGRPPVAKADAQYYRDVYDGKEMWAYFRPPRNRERRSSAAGKVGIQRGRSSKHFTDIVGLRAPTHWLQGYLSERGDRVDTLFHKATTLAVRNARETVGNSVCEVLDFSSPYGQGTLWFDPERGYLLAQAEVYQGQGHFTTDGVKLNEGASAHFTLRDVSFEKVDGVWFATGGNVMSDLRVSPGAREVPGAREIRTNRPRITNIRLNPDLDALGLFSKDDIEEGALVGYIGIRGVYTWQNGRLVADNSRR